MSQTTPPEPAGGPPSSGLDGTPVSAFDEAAVRSYVEANFTRYAPEALSAALNAAGHDPNLVANFIAQSAAWKAAEPVRSRARRLVVAAYALTYLVFTVGLLGSSRLYGAGSIAVVVLSVVLGLAFWISVWWAGRRGTGMGFAGLVVVPAILLVIVGGACYATTGAPFGYLGQPAADPFAQPAGNPPDEAPTIAPAYPAY